MLAKQVYHAASAVYHIASAIYHLLSTRQKRLFLRDAFLAAREAHFVRDADALCDARLRRVKERIASPITA